MRKNEQLLIQVLCISTFGLFCPAIAGEADLGAELLKGGVNYDNHFFAGDYAASTSQANHFADGNSYSAGALVPANHFSDGDLYSAGALVPENHFADGNSYSAGALVPENHFAAPTYANSTSQANHFDGGNSANMKRVDPVNLFALAAKPQKTH